MIRYLPILIAVALLIYCVIELAQAPRDAVRAMPKWLWFFAIVLLPVVGPAAWLLLGRPNARSLGQHRRTPLSPDDDPDFLRRL
ncbi:PLD nuclease N-terminal domain-containing protein [Naumannella cuiyingiana]|uniref:Cytochrome bd-type quinol oxidase subunit 2 n=1 Tax=Naumannella cuiyingiana TaxID=1347891 RepID=A0A7Z0D833_9ACTN|nr:PLD nuclease N-terminal domain-containing protein [Naumannella cuiyingiana]NYI70632.1 cytochrome bd-type quinol oxidase subunit 2 [Naumannella cuiyingiana]